MFGQEIAMGPGKAELLEAIAATGSISASAKRLGMSYRRAWLLVDTMNRCFREPVVASATGGAGRYIRRYITAMRRIAALVFALAVPAVQAQGALVFAAASLKEALDEVAASFAAGRAGRVDVSYGASGTLARQIERGAPADIFISADTDWAFYLRQRGLVAGAPRDLLANDLVLVAPASSGVQVQLAPGVDLARLLGKGRLAMADPATAPAGRYGKAALASLGAWKALESRIAAAENVRAALALVARGEAPLGIVYRTDALAEKGVRIVDKFPAGSHAPIVYPLLVLKRSSSPVAGAFAGYLATPEARAIFERHGFRTP